MVSNKSQSWSYIFDIRDKNILWYILLCSEDRKSIMLQIKTWKKFTTNHKTFYYHKDWILPFKDDFFSFISCHQFQMTSNSIVLVKKGTEVILIPPPHPDRQRGHWYALDGQHVVHIVFHFLCFRFFFSEFRIFYLDPSSQINKTSKTSKAHSENGQVTTCFLRYRALTSFGPPLTRFWTTHYPIN